jgi:ABC-type dipeptide/oligopeptide/nickel transport system permease subunit
MSDPGAPFGAWTRFVRHKPARRVALLLGLVVLACVATLPWTLGAYDRAHLAEARTPPGLYGGLMGTDMLGRSLLARTLLGGVVSLGVGLAAAAISVGVGVAWGLAAGWMGGRVDQVMMRIVDVLYGLPYILLVILLKVGLDDLLIRRMGWPVSIANVTVLLISIGAVSWLTMARVIRGQVLSLKSQPFIESARAIGMPAWRIGVSHVLPNLVGPIVVYAAMTVPQAILQESFLSFLGIGIEKPLPSWGNLAADGVTAINNVEGFWWTLAFPCGLLTATLLALNFLGDQLRAAFDPRA